MLECVVACVFLILLRVVVDLRIRLVFSLLFCVLPLLCVYGLCVRVFVFVVLFDCLC